MIKLWLILFFRGILFWVVLNWTIFLLVDSYLTSVHLIYQKLIYKFLLLSVISYLLSLYPYFFMKLFQTKDLLDFSQIKYFLKVQTQLWGVVFLSFIFLITNKISEELLINLLLIVPISLFSLSCFLISFNFKRERPISNINQ